MPDRYPWPLLLVIALFAGAAGFRPVSDPDMPWHIMQAGLVLEQGTWSLVDTTSFTVPNTVFVDHPWLGQLLLRALYSLGGPAAMTLYSAGGGLVTALAVGLVAWEYSDRRPWATVLTAALVMPVVVWRLGPRPLLLFLIFLPIGMLLARRLARAEGRHWMAYGGALVLLQAVWIHVHGSYVVLPAVTCIALLERVRQVGLRGTLPTLAVPALMGVLILVFADLGDHVELIGNVALGDSTRYIAEMRPLQLTQLMPCFVDSILFLDILLLLALVFSIRRGRVRLEDLGMLLLGLAFTSVAHRFRAAWAILLIPIVARPAFEEAGSRVLRFAALLAALVTVPAVTIANSSRRPELGFGMGIHRAAFPVDPVDFLERQKAQGNLLNFYDDGGYIASRLWPDVKIAIDGRTPTVFDDELYYLLRQAASNARALSLFDQRYGPDMAMPMTQMAQCRFMADSADWRAVYASATRAVFFKAGFRPDVPALKGLDPCNLLGTVKLGCEPSHLSAVQADLERLLEVTPDAPALLAVASEIAAVCHHDVERAVRLSDRAVATGTRAGAVWLASARALASAQLHDEALARAEFASAMRAGVDADVLQASILRGAGRTEEALERYRDVLDKYGDSTPVGARVAYAEVLAQDGQWGIAKLHAQRALWVESSTRARILLEAAP